MPKHANLAADNLDDRRELHRLLERLPPRARVGFLAWCCRQATLTGCTTHPGVSKKTWDKVPAAEHDDTADRKLALEVYFDLWTLSLQYEFSLEVALLELVRWARKAGRAWGCSTPVGPVATATVR